MPEPVPAPVPPSRETPLPCPFCGAPVEVDDDDLFYITCKNKGCFADVTVGSGNRENAVVVWNTRAPLSAPDQPAAETTGGPLADEARMIAAKWYHNYCTICLPDRDVNVLVDAIRSALERQAERDAKIAEDSSDAADWATAKLIGRGIASRIRAAAGRDAEKEV